MQVENAESYADAIKSAGINVAIEVIIIFPFLKGMLCMYQIAKHLLLDFEGAQKHNNRAMSYISRKCEWSIIYSKWVAWWGNWF